MRFNWARAKMTSHSSGNLLIQLTSQQNTSFLFLYCSSITINIPFLPPMKAFDTSFLQDVDTYVTKYPSHSLFADLTPPNPVYTLKDDFSWFDNFFIARYKQ